MCDRVASEDHFLIVHCPENAVEAVDDSLAALKLIHPWFVTSKMIKRPFTALYADDNILYF